MKFWSFHGGVKPPAHKELSNQQPIVQSTLPSQLILPLLQHIGQPAESVVQVGEKVLKGQIVARCHSDNCDMLTTAPIHAPTSGTVVEIADHPVPHPSGLTAPCIVLKSDGDDRWIDLQPLKDYRSVAPVTVRQHIAQSGIVGLGGAGFPSHMKHQPEGIDMLILNGAECEPYITCDDRLMRERADEIIGGAEILMNILGGAKHCLIAVEDNKPEAFAALQTALQHWAGKIQGTGHIEVVQVPSRYPMGGERQLIQVLTGKEVGKKELPASVGIVMHNVETTKAIFRSVHYGEPLISRTVTVTGHGIETPRNVETLLGTPMSHLLDFCGRKPELAHLVMGGPMMGFALPSDALPVVKTTNCLLTSTTNETPKVHEPMPCIRCGACEDSCPINLLPQQLYWYAKSKDFKQAQAYHLFDCIDCGCCAYVCPSEIPLVDYYRYAKAEIRAADRERNKASIARQRHEFRQMRIERDKAEKAAKHKKKAALPKKSAETVTANTTDKQAVIAAAVERAKVKKAEVEKEAE